MDARELPAHPSLEQFEGVASDLVKAYDLGDAEAMQRLKDHFQAERSLTRDELRAETNRRLTRLLGTETDSAHLALAEAQLLVARSYGFASALDFAHHLEAVNQESSAVPQFESAVDAVISGDVATLEQLLRKNPELARTRSTRIHRATLLHYVSANGVEGHRQKCPKNAVLVAETLLRAGAEVDALAETYGGGALQTTLNLLVSSCHPAQAGVQAGLVETLVDFGAAPNGIEDDGSPLITALAFHYSDAAEALVRRGARVDTIVAGAGLGREDLVKSFIDSDGNLKAEVPLVEVGWVGLPKDPKANMDLALVWASKFGHTGVVEFLLQQGVNPGVKDPSGFTSLHWAAHYGQRDTVELLLKWKAPLEARNPYDGTVLDQTIWATVHEQMLPDHVLIIQMLLDAAAKPDRAIFLDEIDWWLGADRNPPLDERVVEVLRRHCAKS